MRRFLISFDEGWMVIPPEELEQVGEDVRAVVRDAKAAGVWVFGGGLNPQRSTIVDGDGVVSDGPYPETKEVIGGFSVVDTETREEAEQWAAKLAKACRSKQEVREMGYDTEA